MKVKPIIALTMGDPGGVGPEIILKSLKDIRSQNAFILLMIGSQSVFEYAAETIGMTIRMNLIPTLDHRFLREDTVNLLDVSDEADVLYERVTGKKRKEEDVFDVGVVSPLNASLAYTSIKVAAYQAACGLVNTIVTAPVNKTAMKLIDPDFKGHTEFLAHIAKSKEHAMLFYSPHFCVTLVTIHLPLNKVSAALSTSMIFSKIKLTDEFLRLKLKIDKPRIAVACLNPHGSEFGSEEHEIIEPAVLIAKKSGIKVSGPLPGDQVFYEAYSKNYDAVIAMYHDQGLAPFKMIAFDEGVNVTLGLPFVRTSPDHGTGFDIAYSNKAKADSFTSALRFAIRLTS